MMETLSLQALNGSSNDAVKQIKLSGGSESGSFFALLAASMNEKHSASLNGINAAPDAEQLSESLKGLLPEDEELWKESMLESESVQELMAMLPASLREEIEIFFHSLQDKQFSGSALSKEGLSAATILALLHHQAEGNLPKEESGYKDELLQSIKRLAEVGSSA
jgi:hypothetical protein